LKIICKQNSKEGPNKNDFSIKIYLDEVFLDLYTSDLESYNTICQLFDRCLNLSYKSLSYSIENHEDYYKQLSELPRFDKFGLPILTDINSK